MKYYKITNATEKHNGMKYKTGLNVDVLPYNPNGDCATGGIYFSREDILFFLSYGKWIREVTIPDGEAVYENPGRPKRWKAHRVILGKRRKVTAKVIKELIKEGADVNERDARGQTALMWAVQYEHTELVELLIANGADVNAKDNDGWTALIWAARCGHTETVKPLKKHGARE